MNKVSENKKGISLALASFVTLLLVVLGCGGGGGGVSQTTGGAGFFPYQGQYLEIQGPGGIIDPMNLLVGQSYQLYFANYDPFGNRTVLAASSWTVSGAGVGNVTLSQAGLLTINSLPNGVTTIQATATVAGQQEMRELQFFVPSSVATTSISGQLLSTDGITGVSYAQIEFYDINDTLVGGAWAMGSGLFTGKTLSTAVKMKVRPTTIPDPYYRALKYQSKDYATVGFTCLLPLPTLTSGANNTLPAPIYVPRLVDGPPPPPTGCN